MPTAVMLNPVMLNRAMPTPGMKAASIGARFLTAVVVVAIGATPSPVHAASSTESATDTPSALASALEPMVDAHSGVVTLVFEHLETGERVAIAGDRPMPSASLIKLPLMVATYDAAARGVLSLDDRVTLAESDKVPGSGLLTQHFSDGIDMSVRDAVRLMIGWSDNTATNLVIDALGGAVAEDGDDATTAGLKACNAFLDSIGLPVTRLNSKVYRRSTSVAPRESEQFGLGRINATETVALLKRLADGDPFGSGAGRGHGEADVDGVKAMCREMLDHLRACKHKSNVPELLPAEVQVANKTGSIDAARCDGGLIEGPTGMIAYCVLTAENEDRSWGDDNAAKLLMQQLGKAAFAYFTEGPGAIEAPRVARVLRMGVEDPLVVPVQRTLNSRVKPSPGIAVDGDFGPGTRGAVIALQRQEGIPETGEVDPATWAALGPLLMDDEPVPPPQQVNVAPLPELAEQDALTGPPITTAEAWLIADGETAKPLFGHNDAAVRDPASTTKMMTAYLVAELAAADPAVLEETVTFSERADNTVGSTADVRVGESLPAGELLYGLMLPSGNDASVALAEHFGDRFPGDASQSSFDRFISAMNAKADELGMADTGYKNPHGLTADGHVTTARDLLKLAHAGMKLPAFREVVKTRRRGATVTAAAGYTRNVVWLNTNRLLRNYEGFYGVKTGTTGRAGACLVSIGERAGKAIYVIVLGSTSESRYVDARNLYRYGWKELGVE